MYQYTLENIWKTKSSDLKEEIVDFWLAENVVSLEAAKQRVPQVFFIARDLQNEIIGVNTIYKEYNQQLTNFVYCYRTYISPRARTYNMTGEMLSETKQYLEARFLTGRDNDIIGLLLEVENKQIKKRLNQAIWPTSNFIYIGTNKRGDHLRIFYFKNALISAYRRDINDKG